MLVLFSIIGCIIALCLVNKILPTQPFVCPKCKKESKELERWSYTEYMLGARCPHCKYEVDITP